MRFIFTGILVLTLISCKQKEVAVQTQAAKSIELPVNEFNSSIQGRILKRFKADERYGQPFVEHFCMADVLLEKIIRYGQNYHGQYEEGDTLRLFFHFTLENTEALFPELEQVLPGLKVKDVFEAELTEKEGEPPFTVYLYNPGPNQ